MGQPGGLRDGLSVALTADGACWGLLHLFRDHDGRRFTTADVDAVRKIVPTLGRRLRRSTIDPAGGRAAERRRGRNADPRSRPRPGGVDAGGGPLALPPPADRTWGRSAPRIRLRDRCPARSRCPATLDPPAAHPRRRRNLACRARGEVVRKLGARRRGHRSDDRTRMPGGFTSAVDAGAQVVRARAGSRSAGGARAHDLELASALFITRHTVADHLKAIYDKLGVNSRGELTSMLGGLR
ncbi:LuxR C-terminal-related transcriptional regulator [Amycolatopsis sp. NPDC051373]|uniref:LuxR C-terminal-related transcriptional regulator n=1 Tax=Amycolatopsis sp. NPDC051373 TaxID=3155801 RepID=UPI00344BBDDA